MNGVKAVCSVASCVHVDGSEAWVSARLPFVWCVGRKALRALARCF